MPGCVAGPGGEGLVRRLRGRAVDRQLPASRCACSASGTRRAFPIGRPLARCCVWTDALLTVTVPIHLIACAVSFPSARDGGYNGAGLAEAAELQFQLQFTWVQHSPGTSTLRGDLHRWTPVDAQRARTADS